MIRTQLVERLAHTTLNESISRADWAGFAAGEDSFSGCDSAFSGIFGNIIFGSSSLCGGSPCGVFPGGQSIGSGLHSFMCGLLNLADMNLANSERDAAQPAVDRLTKRPAQKLSIRPYLEPKTTYRSREHRQLAMFSF